MIFVLAYCKHFAMRVVCKIFDADVMSGGRGATVDNLQLIKDLIEVFRQKE